ncbi:MAG: gliding motility-associated protein GldE [Muribaculaceae bacterium]|nr:gliding motility-associated protein GldE [Muribaculaceae bacterium]
MSTLAAVMTQFDLSHIAAIVCALLALCVSAFVSGSEIAYFSITPEQAEELAEDSRWTRVLKLVSNPERLLATILIVNNLVNVTIVVLLNFALAPIFDTLRSPVLSFLLQSVLLTFLILLFGEILPKLIANTNTLRWARVASSGVAFMMKLTLPLSAMLVRSSGFVGRVVTKHDDDVTAQDLSQALEITDVKTNSDKEMLEGILRFGDTTASEVMTPRVDMTDIDIHSTFDEVMRIVIDSGYSRLPVYEDSEDNIRGVLYSRDLLPYVGKADNDFDWRKLLREPYYVPESRMIDDLMEDFRRRRIHMAIVIDEFGGTQGIVTLEDVLEEIVGDINDEYDDDEKTYKRLPDDTYVFEGKTVLSDFFRVTGLNEEDYSDVTEDCETLAGMLLAIKGDFPKDKEPLVYGRCRFLVLNVVNHRIADVRVKVMSEIQQPISHDTK